MVEAISSSQAKLIDRQSQDIFHIPAIILMENAGIETAVEIKKLLKPKPAEKKPFKGKSRGVVKNIVFICGTGNNGGDGLAAARHIINSGVIGIEIVIIGSKDKFSPQAGINYKILNALGAKIKFYPADISLAELKEKLQKALLIVDALLGIGLKGKVKSKTAKVISSINASESKVLAVDTPSGLNVDTGRPAGACVKADITVTFGLAKIGFYMPTSRKFCGKIVVKPITFPRALLKGEKI